MEPRLTGYIGTSLQVVGNASHDKAGGLCLNIGGKAEKNGFYAQAEGGYGTALYAKVEAGKDFSLGENNFKINTSIGGQYVTSTRERSYYKSVFEEGANSPTWKPNDTRGYVGAEIKYEVPTFKAGIGVKGGVKSSNQPSLDGVELAPVGVTSGTEYAGRTTKAYITPTVELEAGKKFKFCLNASFDEVSIGGKFCF